MISYAYIYNISSKVFKNITVINYFTFLNFPEGKPGQVISPHFTDEVTGYQMTTLSMSLGQFQRTCQIFFSSGLPHCLSPGLFLFLLTTSYQSSGDVCCYCDWKVLISSQIQGRAHTENCNKILATIWGSRRCTEQSDRSPYWLLLVLFLTRRAVHLLSHLRA